eukprot:gene10226-biopygen22795
MGRRAVGVQHPISAPQRWAHELAIPHHTLGVSARSCSWGHRTVARAWRGHGVGVARAIGHCLACVARAWRGHVL